MGNNADLDDMKYVIEMYGNGFFTEKEFLWKSIESLFKEKEGWKLLTDKTRDEIKCFLHDIDENSNLVLSNDEFSADEIFKGLLELKSWISFNHK